MAGFGVGRWLGGEDAPAAPSPRPAALEARLAERQPEPAPASHLISEVNEEPPAEPEDPRAGLVRELAAHPGDPAEALGVAIDSLRDDEIIAALATATGIGAEELRDVRDPRAMAKRMSQIALEDVIRPSGERPPGLARVYFSEESLAGDPAESPAAATKFSGRSDLVATFPTAEYDLEQVFVKWTRLDDPEIVDFGPAPVIPGADYGEAWLRPDSALRPGRYKVGVFSADEAMRPLADGRYRVVAEKAKAD
jgi:hypothetical protein